MIGAATSRYRSACGSGLLVDHTVAAARHWTAVVGAKPPANAYTSRYSRIVSVIPTIRDDQEGSDPVDGAVVSSRVTRGRGGADLGCDVRLGGPRSPGARHGFYGLLVAACVGIGHDLSFAGG